MSGNLLMLNPSKIDFVLTVLPKQLSQTDNQSLSVHPDVSVYPVVSARNLGIHFDPTLSQYDLTLISWSINKSCVRDLRRIRTFLDQTTARNIATALIHSKLDCCNSIFLNLPANQLDRLQLVLNSAACSCCNKYFNISSQNSSNHWLKIAESTNYKIISITYKCILSTKPTYLRNVLIVSPLALLQSYNSKTFLQPFSP